MGDFCHCAKKRVKPEEQLHFPQSQAYRYLHKPGAVRPTYSRKSERDKTLHSLALQCPTSHPKLTVGVYLAYKLLQFLSRSPHFRAFFEGNDVFTFVELKSMRSKWKRQTRPRFGAPWSCVPFNRPREAAKLLVLMPNKGVSNSSLYYTHVQSFYYLCE